MAAAAPRTHQQQDQGWLHRAAVLWTGGVQAPGVVLVHFNIVIYAMAFWLTNPMLPFLLREHGASNLSFGMFQSLFALVQMGGGLTVGLLQDRTSSATALSVTQMGSSVVYLILLCAGSLEMLYLSRLPTVLQQAMQVAQAYLSKVTPDTNRAVAFSRVSVSYTIGMALGSTASGFIAEAFGTRSVMGLSFALSVAMVIINRLFLPDTPALPLQRSADDKVKPSTPSSATSSNAATADTKITGYWSMVCALPKLFLFFAMVFVTRSLYEPVFTLQLLDKYSVGQSQMGYLMSIASAIGLAANVLLLPLLLKWTNESRVQAGAILVGCTMYGVIALVPLSLNGFMGVALVMAGAAALLYTTAASYLTAKVPTGIHGQAIASTHALRSAVGIVGPLAGTALLEGWGPGAVAGVNAVLLGSSLFFM